MLRFSLRKLGAELIEAGNGEEALQILSRNDAIGLVFADLNMPVLDGFEFIRRLKQREQYSKIPIVVMTVETAAPDIEKALALGVAGYITKPLRSDTVAAVAKRFLQI